MSASPRRICPTSTSPAALTTLFTAQVIGYLADKHGKKRVFTIVALLSLIPIFITTHLPRVSLAWVIVVDGRVLRVRARPFGPAMALVTGSVSPRLRGSFMSFNASMQQLSVRRGYATSPVSSSAAPPTAR